ncbi:unnamed protein product [Peniophora sp. CBMAI 1063]|nr:unnamed protein product [Peniophora sp. CBMAI 1063]
MSASSEYTPLSPSSAGQLDTRTRWDLVDQVTFLLQRNEELHDLLRSANTGADAVLNKNQELRESMAKLRAELDRVYREMGNEGQRQTDQMHLDMEVARRQERISRQHAHQIHLFKTALHMSTMLIARLDDHLAHFMESRDAARAEVTDLQLQLAERDRTIANLRSQLASAVSHHTP